MPDESGPARAPPAGTARFVSGPTMRHVVVMTGAGSVGLVAVFVVDLLSLLYISWLGKPALTAGVGLATIVLFWCIRPLAGVLLLPYAGWVAFASALTYAIWQRNPMLLS